MSNSDFFFRLEQFKGPQVSLFTYCDTRSLGSLLRTSKQLRKSVDDSWRTLLLGHYYTDLQRPIVQQLISQELFKNAYKTCLYLENMRHGIYREFPLERAGRTTVGPDHLAWISTKNGFNMVVADRTWKMIYPVPIGNSRHLVINQNSLCFEGSTDGTITVHDLCTKTVVKKMEGHMDCITAMLAVGKRLISSSWDGTVRFWEGLSQDQEARVTVYDPKGGPITALAIEKNILIAGLNNGQMHIRDEQANKSKTIPIPLSPSHIVIAHGNVLITPWGGEREKLFIYRLDQLLQDDLTPTMIEGDTRRHFYSDQGLSFKRHTPPSHVLLHDVATGFVFNHCHHDPDKQLIKLRTKPSAKITALGPRIIINERFWRKPYTEENPWRHDMYPTYILDFTATRREVLMDLLEESKKISSTSRIAHPSFWQKLRHHPLDVASYVTAEYDEELYKFGQRLCSTCPSRQPLLRRLYALLKPEDRDMPYDKAVYKAITEGTEQMHLTGEQIANALRDEIALSF